MAGEVRQRKTWNSHFPLAIGLLSIGFLFLSIGIWGARANISGAVIGTGTLEVSQTMTAVQHPIGGVVDEILARDGDHVEAGDVVVRLDATQLRSDLTVVEGDLFETLANIARLEAAIDDREEMELHPLLQDAAATRPELATLLQREQRQLDEHFKFLNSENELLLRQITQIEAQIAGVRAQIAAKEEEKEFVSTETQQSKELADKGLLKLNTLFNLEKADVLINGEIGRLTASLAELEGRISEFELKRHAIAPAARKLAVAELSKLRPERTRFLERRSIILENLSRLEIRAPITGKVHDSKVQGIKSVIVAASPLMMIVPDSQPAIVEVRINATDIDQVYVGQEASLKFKAFNGRHIPIILGMVNSVSANVFMDATTRKSYYEVTVVLRETEMSKLGEVELLPGMPVEAFLATESRTPLNYVLRPLLTYFDRAFRDT